MPVFPNAPICDDAGNRIAETIGGVTTLYLTDMQNPTGYDQPLEAKNTRPMTHEMLPVVPFHGDGKGSHSITVAKI